MTARASSLELSAIDHSNAAVVRQPLIYRKKNVLIKAAQLGTANFQAVTPEQFFRSADGTLYMLYEGIGSAPGVVCLMKNPPSAGRVPRGDDPINYWTDLGYVPVVGNSYINYGSPCIVYWAGTYYIFAGGTSTGQGVHVYSCTNPEGPYAFLGDAILVGIGSIPAPSGVTAAPAAGGTLVAGTYYYRVSALDAKGETTASTEVSCVLTATGSVLVSWPIVNGETGGYNIYGRTTGGELKIGTVAHATGPTVTFTDNGSVAPAGALPVANTAGMWDEARCMEPWVFYDAKGGVFRLLYNGKDYQSTHEQVGMATISSANFPLTGGWTKSPLNPILPIGPPGAHDELATSDPSCMQVGSVYVIFHTPAMKASSHDAQRWHMPAAFSTSDWQTFTRLGCWGFAPAMVDPSDGTSPGLATQHPAAAHIWRGSPFPDDDGLIYWPHAGNAIRNEGTGITPAGGFFVSVIDPISFAGGAVRSAGPGVPGIEPWLRVEGEATDPRITKTGTWAVFADTNFSAGHDIESQTAAATISFTAEMRAFRVQGVIRKSYGLCNIKIDGSYVAQNIDCSTAYDTGPTLVFLYQIDFINNPLSICPGVHTVTVEVVGQAGAAGTGKWIGVDFFDYVPVRG